MKHLQHKNILLTRTPEQNIETAKLLASFAANPVYFPCMQVTSFPDEINKGLEALERQEKEACDIIFSSTNGVHAVAAQTKHLANALGRTRIVAVGRKTAQALAQYGIEADILPDDESQAGLVEYYRQNELPERAFFFRAREGSNALEDFFQANGIPLILIPCYDTSCNQDSFPDVLQQLTENTIDAVLLGSAKTSQFYVEKVSNLELANRPVVVVMSPQVAQAADKLGLSVQVIAEEPGFRAMLDGLNRYYENSQ